MRDAEKLNTSGTLARIRASLDATGHARCDIGELPVGPDMWRDLARQAGQEIGRLVVTMETDAHVLASIVDWPQNNDDRRTGLGRLQCTIEDMQREKHPHAAPIPGSAKPDIVTSQMLTGKTEGTSDESPDGTDQGVESELRKLTKREAQDLDRGRLSDKVRKILGDADRRDDEATVRDDIADERASAADRDAFTSVDATYVGHGERRAAALDRADSKIDRESSADDRTHITEDEAADEAATTREIRTLKQKITELEKLTDTKNPTH
ncbi:hypothetical protein [Frondihabitans sp. PAMC 28766]|uniref:hypothetical protein n=1 Tax=Frondihabitans sp. PAMC 28766 TaxID=1795630 RepID=UPI0012FF7581|nr:hypothetical protein [Frondihabitans sp. PAMC 28766]